MSEVSYDVIRKKFPDVYCMDNLRRIYKHNDLSMSFTDFLFYVEDYYLLKYAGTLSKTAWWLFSLLRTLVRYDGFVKLTYKDILDRFNIEGKERISKPTFFKYVDELESFGLIKRYNNKKLFNANYQNDSNTYVVLGKVNEIVDICLEVSDRDSFRELVVGVEVVQKPKKKKVKDEKSCSEWYEEISSYYADIWPQVEEYFTFLGRSNKTGKIGLSRKVRIARFFYERDDSEENIVYAIEQSMSRNVDNEAYMLKIIKSVREREEAGYYRIPASNKGMTEEEYKEYCYELLRGSDKHYYKTILEVLSQREEFNNYEQRLYDVAMTISRKMEIHDQHFDKVNERMDFLEDECGIVERYTYDGKFNRILRWFYAKDESPVPLDAIKGIKRKHKDLFAFYKYEKPDGRYYDGL